MATAFPFSMNPDDYKTLPIPPRPQTQGLTSTTFKIPPLDGSLSLPEIYDWHAENSPNHPLFEFAEDDGTVRTITWKEGVKGVHRAGRYVRNKLTEFGETEARPVVAILAASDFITYYAVLVGIMRAGYVAFFISPRNSVSAVAHLLTKTNSTHVFVGPEENLQTLAQSSIKLMQSQSANVGEGWTAPKTWTMPIFEDLFPGFAATNANTRGEEETFEYLPKVKFSLDDLAIVTHSSGSTAYPKPIRFTHYRYLIMCNAPFFGELDKTGLRMSSHSIPMFHGMGMIHTAWTAACGVVVTALRPRAPAIPITAENVLKGAADTKSDIIFCVPTFIEDWARDPNAVKQLQKTKGILFGGGPLSKAVGDELTDQGINIFNTYGIGECGGVMSPLYPERLDKEWEYFRFTPNITPFFIQDESGYSEAFILPNKYHVPNILNATVEVNGEKRAAYATSDYLAPHPTKPGYWKIIDRVDNQIIHNTGEKTNPGPLESILHHDPHIESAVMFGRGRFNVGVLIDPRPAHQFNPSNLQKLAEFRDKIWPSVEKANEYAPQHSRIFKEMILVASPSKPFDYTAKFTARRQAMVALYKPEIEALYATVDETTHAELQIPSHWDLHNTTIFVRNVITKVIRGNLGDEDDFFQKGCDSLQATWIRNSILHGLRNSRADVNVRQIPTSFIYRYPTISKLSSYVSSLLPSAGGFAANEHSKAHDPVPAMLNMVAKYGSDFPVHRPSTIPNSMKTMLDTVLVTGTTGGLGASLLSALVQSGDVEKVYALNRRREGTGSLKQRQRLVLQDRGLNSSLVDSPKIEFLEADLAEPRLGLPQELFEQIVSSVTHIIHNAYQVDWKPTLESFEPHVHVFRNLIDVSLSSPRSRPPTILLTSSIAVLRHQAKTRALTETLVPPESAAGSGYSEAKWVCEKLASLAAEKTTLRPVIVRIGQIAGSASGAWKPTEWVPSMIRSSVYVGALPTEDKVISWMRVEDAAQAIIEMRNASAVDPTPYIVHLAHPRPVPSGVITTTLSESLGIPSIPFHQWVTLLEQSSPSDDNPALKILDYFRDGREGNKTEAFGVVQMDMSNTLKSSRSWRSSVRELDEKDVQDWLAYWRRIGFL
ncbi:unnamed protein product [Somion occarium]|uniref:Acetyl-CoA synthetase-like protein n=1 Tax=Somion occarium TaxID=3059160 RepID=A0ABP1DRJ0_9APHY